MTDDKQAYIEEAGILLESVGLPRMWGRVFGALLVADPPEQSAEQLAATLRAGRGSISTATRMLEQRGLIDRVSRPGERKDYFRNKPGAWHEIVQRRNEFMHGFHEFVDKGLKMIEHADPEVRRGLEEMREYILFFEREFPNLLRRWEEEHAGPSSK